MEDIRPTRTMRFRSKCGGGLFTPAGGACIVLARARAVFDLAWDHEAGRDRDRGGMMTPSSFLPGPSALAWSVRSTAPTRGRCVIAGSSTALPSRVDRRSAPRRMAELRVAPAHIQARSGRPEGPVEKAPLSLLVEALTRSENMSRPAGILRELACRTHVYTLA